MCIALSAPLHRAIDHAQVGSECVVTLVVSKQPPWSMARSTTTDPRFDRAHRPRSSPSTCSRPRPTHHAHTLLAASGKSRHRFAGTVMDGPKPGMDFRFGSAAACCGVLASRLAGRSPRPCSRIRRAWSWSGWRGPRATPSGSPSYTSPWPNSRSRVSPTGSGAWCAAVVMR